jgi:hypothetical protein
MSEGKEIEKALCRLIAEIADREKKKAIQNDDYGTALTASFVEGLFKEADNRL